MDRRSFVRNAATGAAADLGQDVAMWSCRVALSSPEISSVEMASQMADDLHPGAVYLVHDGTSGREDDERLEDRRLRELPALARFLDGVQSQGYRCVTLSELADRATQPVA